jgi:hypothetical protein
MIELFKWFVLLIIIFPIEMFSQEIYKAEGQSQVRQETNMTKEQAIDKAIELAMVNAIENRFGTYIGQESNTRIKEGRVNFDYIGTNKVRGEWIRTKDIKIDEETRTIQGKYGKEQEVWVLCHITGEVRECVSRADIVFSTLNCPMNECRRTEFFNDEDIFVYFKSPVDGYLSIFLDEGDNTLRLLPYKSMGTRSAVEIEGDKDYIFFSRDKALMYDPQYKTDALELYTDQEIEYNDIYVVFAENPYVKPILNDVKELENGYFVPKSLGSEDFFEWLADCKAEMRDFQAVRVRISIER